MRTNFLLLMVVLFLAGCEQELDPNIMADPLPDSKSVGAQLTKKYCSSCHAPPLPSTHPKKEWAAVVNRMQNYRIIRGYGAVAEPEMRRLIRYYERNAT